MNSLIVHGPDNKVVYGELSWWKKTLIYHVYVPSFSDADGDGIGDLRGRNLHIFPQIKYVVINRFEYFVRISQNILMYVILSILNVSMLKKVKNYILFLV